MSINIGIVGLPNVGKSTLFNALAKGGAEAANFPFCTIEPNVGVVPVPDPRLVALQKLNKSEKVIPTALEFVDIAGLVKGASKGEGLGNQFLAHIREVHAIAHVVRCFEDPNVIHVEGSVNPVRDVETIELELCLADLDSVEKRIERTRRNAKSPGKAGDDAKLELGALERLKATLSEGKPASLVTYSEAEAALLKEVQLLTNKPVLFVANVAEKDAANPDAVPYVQQLQAFAKPRGSLVVPISAAIEAECAQLSEEERLEFLQSMGLEEPGLNKVIRAGYQLLGLITYLTAGPKEVRAWTVKRGSKAPQAAGVIHTDFERGFIRAEVIAYDDYNTLGSEAAVKAAGKMRVEGKEYVVQDGDVMHFRFNV
ncbi:MAG: redox-regulated ATPase YchF [Deltaproteobacteria bacterium]|nr:redox-regulated ATPase YchF [Deltaproteobacteria bacterium]